MGNSVKEVLGHEHDTQSINQLTDHCDQSINHITSQDIQYNTVHMSGEVERTTHSTAPLYFQQLSATKAPSGSFCAVLILDSRFC